MAMTLHGKVTLMMMMMMMISRGRNGSYRLCKNLVKGKVTPVPFLSELHAMKAYWGVEV
jgi:hypothetical protein